MRSSVVRLAPLLLASHLFGLVALAGCAGKAPVNACPSPVTAAAPAPEAVTQQVEPQPVAPLEILRANLEQTVGFLASDALHGRYTLSPDIQVAANWLAAQHQANGVGAYGEQYVHPYALLVAEGETQAPQLSATVKGKTRTVEAKDMVSLPGGGAAQLAGELVFVGHGLTFAGDEKIAAIDELAGVDLTGKIAVMLTSSPGGLDYTSMTTRLQSAREDFKKAVKAATSAEGVVDTKKRERAAKDFRGVVQQVLAVYVDKDAAKKTALEAVPQPLPEDFTGEGLGRALWHTLQARPQAALEGSDNRLRRRIARLKQANAVGVILLVGPESFLDAKARKEAKLDDGDHGPSIVSEEKGLPGVRMMASTFDTLVKGTGFSAVRAEKKLNKSGKAASQAIEGISVALQVAPRVENRQVPNVVAFIPGTDLAQEIVVVGAHFDHIGSSTIGDCTTIKREQGDDVVCNGADDNASGTATVLELARAMAQRGASPRRSVAFVHFSGEELGLLGSSAFGKQPPFPLDKVVAMVNVDMIGRLSERGVLVGGLATARQWESLLDHAGTFGLKTIYDAASTSRSDHATFLENKIPSLFFFTGVHEDYHQAGDEAAKIDFTSMNKIAASVAGLVDQLAFGAKITWSEPPEGKGLVRALPGDNPATIVKEVPAAPATSAAPGTN